jgi:NAD(P)-dependent dehydrogenase (short-subunit alcohol dehydrogenase family)
MSQTHDEITGRTGQEGDIASAVLYLGSRAGAYVNGEVIHVDGGKYLLSSKLESRS